MDSYSPGVSNRPTFSINLERRRAEIADPGGGRQRIAIPLVKSLQAMVQEPDYPILFRDMNSRGLRSDANYSRYIPWLYYLRLIHLRLASELPAPSAAIIISANDGY